MQCSLSFALCFFMSLLPFLLSLSPFFPFPYDFSSSFDSFLPPYYLYGIPWYLTFLHFHILPSCIQEDSLELSDLSSHATPTQQQQITALVILGMIGAEFNTSGRTTPGQTRRNSKGKKRMDSLSSGMSCCQNYDDLKLS